MRVIIADDSKIILDRLHQLLVGLEDVEVVGAFSNGTDALNAIHQLNPDLAILDNEMPGVKGIDIIREVRKEDWKVKLMMLTFYADPYYRKLVLNAGADYFLSKSEDFETIPEVINQLNKNGNR
jgi:DNA-binding NarL/FixJ family response regulator